MLQRWSIVCAFLLATLPAMAQESENPADAIAARMTEASGGSEAWEAVPFVRFNYKLYRVRELVLSTQHLWDKKLGI